MNTFATRIRPAVNAELAAARAADARGDAATAFAHLERAHVLGQASTTEHVRVHVLMLRWALRHRRGREAAGQLLRIAGAATKTALGLVPRGNTGGSNVPAWRPMRVPGDLQRQIDAAQQP